MNPPTEPRSAPARTRGPGSLARATAGRAAAFAGAWWLLTGGSTYGWPLALVSIAAATAASLALLPPAAWRWRVGGFLRFVPFFLWQSARGGVDVALRALHPRRVVRPAELRFPLRLAEGPARTFFVAVAGLLPGTLSLAVRGDELLVHQLDDRAPAEPVLRALETRVADLFGVD